MYRHVPESEMCYCQRSCHLIAMCVCVFLPTVWEKYKGENTLSQKPHRGEMYLYWTEFQGIMGCLILRAQAIFVMVLNDEAPFNFLVDWHHITPTITELNGHFYLLTISAKRLERSILNMSYGISLNINHFCVSKICTMVSFLYEW